MKDVFWAFLIFGICSVAIVSIQSVMLVMFSKWNNELKKQVEYLKPPF